VGASAVCTDRKEEELSLEGLDGTSDVDASCRSYTHSATARPEPQPEPQPKLSAIEINHPFIEPLSSILISVACLRTARFRAARFLFPCKNQGLVLLQTECVIFWPPLCVVGIGKYQVPVWERSSIVWSIARRRIACCTADSAFMNQITPEQNAIEDLHLNYDKRPKNENSPAPEEGEVCRQQQKINGTSCLTGSENSGRAINHVIPQHTTKSRWPQRWPDGA
jgi:hypothetical protein